MMTALAAIALAVGLGALSATDAHSAAGLAWVGTAVAVVVLAAALVVASSAGIAVSLAVLAALLLLRQQDRLVVAPLYGACLLLVGELAQRSLELRGQDHIGPGVIGSRLAAMVAVAALGACGGAAAVIAVTAAPGRSVGFTALGTVALLAAVSAIVVLARRP